jgi:DNA polymerase III subunit epsilon
MKVDQPFFIPKTEEKFLNLSRPIIFFDLETTGTNQGTDRIVEICAIKKNTDGTQEDLYYLINPTIPISSGATSKHGITDDVVADKPTFADLAGEIALFFQDCDLGGYNIKGFDVPMLLQEFHRCKKYPINYNEVKLVDAMGIYHSKEKRDLSAALKFYCDREHLQAHSAKSDVEATIDILKRQLLMYDDLEPNTSFLHNYLSAGASVDGARRFKRNDSGEIIFNFGKHFGQLACTKPDYLKWMVDDGDFLIDTKMVAKKLYMTCIWESEIKKWLSENKVVGNEALAAALYTTVKFEKEVFPFTTRLENAKVVVTYVTEPPTSLTLVHKDFSKILLSLLEEALRSDSN